MTPKEKIYWLILAESARLDGKEPPPFPCEDAEEQYDLLREADKHWDAESEVRCGGVKTNLPCEWSRHYESEARAAQLPDGSWVGWTYWYGGGKHGEPEAVEWIDDAYEVACSEEEKMVVVRTFTVAEEQA